MRTNLVTNPRASRYVSSVAAIVVAAAVQPAVAQNMVANGSFQSSGFFAGWNVQTAPVGSSLSITASFAYSGARAAAFSGTQGVPDRISQIVPTSAGRMYEVSFRYRNIQAGAGPQADAFVAAWENAVIFGGSPAPVNSDEWRHVVLTLPARSSGSELLFAAYDTAAVVVLDDVSVVQDPAILANGGFEFGDFSGWTAQAAPSGSSFSVVNDAAAAHSGDSYASFDGAFSSDRISQGFPTTPGHPYELSFWINNPVSGNDHLRVEWNGIIVYDRTPLDVPAGVWTRVSIPVTAASTTSTLRFSAFDLPSAMRLDDVELTPLPAPLILNGSFELGTEPAGVLNGGSTAMTGWTVSQGNVDWTPSSYWQSSDGSLSVDLQGVAATGGVRQTVNLQSGRRYRLTLAMAGNPDGAPTVKHMRVRAGGVLSPEFAFSTTGRTRSSMGWEDRTFTFDADSSAVEIELLSTDPVGSWGAVVDNVRLVEESCAADINDSGALTVQDIFDFLALYFSGNGRADINNSRDNTVQDIFDYLALYFAGC